MSGNPVETVCLLSRKKEGKELQDMTLEELWQLFPISLVQHSAKWAGQFEKVLAVLQSALATYSPCRISHIGSTAIKGIWAKDIVDVLVELPKGTNLLGAAHALEGCGFTIMSSKEGRVSLNKGYTKTGFADEVYHIHLRLNGDNDELYFRDYLNDHEDVAKEYEELKLSLWKEHEHDRDAYTEAKTDFIAEWTAKAKELYGNRYEA